ncbi:hypothetical protein NDU88_002954 [Pleurodeles waltl]|uniref:Uncharacterized protein n=1 Tax=Pleurodeles waltl TaxID=8319 RepID=A0AAV7PD96_PLEWA|nr:hypothetical protein NDU88_002954 [Pleurodeles waltl]
MYNLSQPLPPLARSSQRQTPGTRAAGTPGAHHVTTSPHRYLQSTPRPLAAAIHEPPADIGGTGSAKSTRHNPKCAAAPAPSPASSGSISNLPCSAHVRPRPLQAAAPPQDAARISRRSGHRGGARTPPPKRSASRVCGAPQARKSTTRAGRESAYRPHRPHRAAPLGPALMSRGNRIKRPIPGPTARVRAGTKRPGEQQH